MRIISRSKLREFWKDHKDAEQPLRAWFAEARRASWGTPHEIKTQYRSASILRKNVVVFNIAGNKYRLVVRVHYRSKIIFIRFIGDHVKYDKINPEEV